MDQNHERNDTTGERRGAGVVGLDQRRPLMRVDLSINIPTILSLIAAVVAISGTGITLYYGLDKRQMSSEIELGKLGQRVEKTEINIGNLRTEQIQREERLRGEMKGDINEIKEMLNRLYFGAPSRAQPVPRPSIEDWRKQ